MLRAYQYALAKRGLRPRTIRSAFHPIKGLCQHLVTHGVLQDDISKTITLPKKDAALRLTITQDQIIAMLMPPKRIHPKRKQVLGKAMIYKTTHSHRRSLSGMD